MAPGRDTFTELKRLALKIQHCNQDGHSTLFLKSGNTR